eukprot:5582226-Heterocapsa_arctica.AAC.1
MGHEVQTCGDYEYCLGCGRNTKAKHSTSAKRVFWRRGFCKPVMTPCLTIGGHVGTVLLKDLN